MFTDDERLFMTDNMAAVNSTTLELTLDCKTDLAKTLMDINSHMSRAYHMSEAAKYKFDLNGALGMMLYSAVVEDLTDDLITFQFLVDNVIAKKFNETFKRIHASFVVDNADPILIRYHYKFDPIVKDEGYYDRLSRM